ncbi:MAG: hypothetical protein ACFFDT_17960 [Candidatus Hodarchaeota archaeon]
MKKIVVKKEYLPNIKNEDKFINAIQLGRIIGAINYNKILYAEISKDKEINTSLQLYLLLNLAALVYEGIKKFKNSKSDFENLNFYKENLDKIEIILNEANDTKSFTNTVLERIRNRIAFHFDKGVIKEVIEQFVDDSLKENKEVVLISGKSELVKDTTYLLADNMNINYILKSINGNEKSEREKFKILCKSLIELSELFCNILDQLIPDLIKDYCELKEEEDEEDYGNNEKR